MASSSSEEQKLIALTMIAAGVLSVDAASISIEQRIPLEIQSNRLYSATDGIRCIILKEFLKPDELEAAPLREYRALELLSNLDIAPQPRAFIPQHQDHNPLVIYDYMEGQMWDRRAPSRNDLKRLAELWIQINEVKSSSLWLSRSQERSKHEIWDGVQAVFDSYLQWTSSHCIQALHTALLAKELAEQRSNIIDDLSGLEVPLCFCRSDPRFANVISRPDGRLGLVDWE
ncbi:MAG: phosphotransferase, partial [Candidatus Promineifilaceae bacterium]